MVETSALDTHQGPDLLEDIKVGILLSKGYSPTGKEGVYPYSCFALPRHEGFPLIVSAGHDMDATLNQKSRVVDASGNEWGVELLSQCFTKEEHGKHSQPVGKLVDYSIFRIFLQTSDVKLDLTPLVPSLEWENQIDQQAHLLSFVLNESGVFEQKTHYGIATHTGKEGEVYSLLNFQPSLERGASGGPLISSKQNRVSGICSGTYTNAGFSYAASIIPAIEVVIELEEKGVLPKDYVFSEFAKGLDL